MLTLHNIFLLETNIGLPCLFFRTMWYTYKSAQLGAEAWGVSPGGEIPFLGEPPGPAASPTTK